MQCALSIIQFSEADLLSVYVLYFGGVKLQLHDVIYRLRFYSKSLSHILSLSNLHNNVTSIRKNRADKSHRVIVALLIDGIIKHLQDSSYARHCTIQTLSETKTGPQALSFIKNRRNKFSHVTKKCRKPGRG